MGKWKMVRLRDVTKINMGQSPASETYNDIGEGLPFFQGKTDFQSMYPTIRMFCNAPQKTANKNDILISVRAPVGAVNIATHSCCIGRGLAAISEMEKVSYYRYLFYYLRYKENDIANMGVGSTFKAISRKDINMVSIPLPPLDVQQKIANVLDKVSALIELRKSQLDKIDLLIKSQFIEMFGEPVINPKGWPVKKLSDFTQFLTSGSRGWARYFTDEGEMFLTIKNVKNGQISTDNVQYIHAPNGQESTRTKVQEGDLLISITADLGRTGVVTKEIADYGAYINQHLSLVRLDKSHINPLYVSHFLESEAGKRQFDSKNQTGVKAGLNFNAIKSLQILVPPIQQQNDYLAFVQQVDKSKFAIQQSLEKLELDYKSLMQKCFRGEIF